MSWDSGRVRGQSRALCLSCSLLEASTQPDFWACLFSFSAPPSSVTHLPVQRQDLLAFFLWETSGWVSMEESEVNKMSQMLGPGRGPTLSAFEQHWPLPHLGRKLSEFFAHQHTSPVGNQCLVLLPDAATRIPDPAPSQMAPGGSCAIGLSLSGWSFTRSEDSAHFSSYLLVLLTGILHF